jgi:hypothetical protein
MSISRITASLDARSSRERVLRGRWRSDRQTHPDRDMRGFGANHFAAQFDR